MFNKKRKNEENIVINQVDEWMKDDYIVVPNWTKPSQLTKYQKLIVLRQPEGEKRVVVDFSLTESEKNRLHNESIEGNIVNLSDNNIFRLIPTSINTKEVNDSKYLSKKEINEVYEALTSSSEEFELLQKDVDLTIEKAPCILRMNEAQSKLINDEILRNQAQDRKKDLNDVDNIDFEIIETDERRELRERWGDVENYIESRDEIDNRLKNNYTDYQNNPKEYLPNEQPLFRNFNDPNLKDEQDLLETNSNELDLIESDENLEFENNKENLNENVNENINDMYENEDPEIEVLNTDSDIGTSTQMQDVAMAADETEEEVITQPKELTFFKNNVDVSLRSNYSVERNRKYIKFYKSDRKFKYQRVKLNKKKKMYMIKKTLVTKSQ